MSARGTGTTADPGRCPSCRAPILRQLVGRTAALNVTADTTPIRRDDEPRLREPNRLTWCLTNSKWAPPHLRWRCTEYRGPCPHHIVIEHRCTRPADQTQQPAAQPGLF